MLTLSCLLHYERKEKSAYLFAARLPLFVIAFILHALEKHVSSPLGRRIARLHHGIRFERALAHCGLLADRRRHCELRSAGGRIGRAGGEG